MAVDEFERVAFCTLRWQSWSLTSTTVVKDPWLSTVLGSELMIARDVEEENWPSTSKVA